MDCLDFNRVISGSAFFHVKSDKGTKHKTYVAFFTLKYFHDPIVSQMFSEEAKTDFDVNFRLRLVVGEMTDRTELSVDCSHCN